MGQMLNFNSKCVILFLFLFANLILPQSNVKSWTQTTLQDFSDNQLNNLIVNNDSTCEVQLPYPLVRTTQDYQNNSVNRFIAKDEHGNFVKTWVNNYGDIYVQKYSANGIASSKAIKVNEVDGSVFNTGHFNAALLNDGTFFISWINNGHNSRFENGNLIGQIFINDSVKQGVNFKLNGVEVYANNKDNNFILLYYNLVGDTEKLFFDKLDVKGIKIGEAKMLNHENLPGNELEPKAAIDEKGFWIAWSQNTEDKSDKYIRHFKFDGTPLSDKILSGGINFTFTMCLDNNSHLFIIGERRSSNSGQNIYGQLYDSSGLAMGASFKVNSVHTDDYNQDPYVGFENNEFQVSWWWINNGLYVTSFKYDPKFSGEMISSIFDGSPSGCSFNEISWDYKSYPHSNLKFQLRSANTIEQLKNSMWYGPTSSSDFYTVNSGQKINIIHNGNRYIQYKAFYTSENGNSPELKSITIKYIPNETSIPNPPLNLTATNNHVHVFLNWQANTEKDVAVYKIYRGVISNNYDGIWYKIIPKNLTSYTDSSALVGKKYYYVVTAIDSSHNESLFSNEAPMMFSGMNVYVDNSVASSGNGSFNSPVKTIQEGMDLASPGDTLKIMPGNYSEPFNTKPRVSIIGAGADKCKIVTIKALDDCVIKGLTISSTLYCQKGSPIITENIIRGNDKGIMLNEYPCSPIITKNFIASTQGIYGGDSGGHTIIKNNIIMVGVVGINIDYGYLTIINNVISASNSAGILMINEYDSNIEKNNILLSDSGGCYANPSLSYNNVWKTKYLDPALLTNNIAVDPQFVNKDILDFRLLSGSLCKNAGDPNPIYNNVDGTRNDIGAYGGPDPFNMVLTSQFSRSINVSSLSGYPGDTISVFISLDNNAGLGKIGFTFQYDNTVLSFLKPELTDATNKFSLDYRNLSSNEIKLTLAANSNTIGMTKNILLLKFVVNQHSKTNDASPLTMKNVTLLDTQLNPIILTGLTNGAFVVNNTADSKNYLYVDSKYTGTGKGSKTNPFKTIMSAITAAIPGDTILVTSGDYPEQITMKEGVYLIGSGALVTNIISGANQNGVLFDNIKNSEISGFTFLSQGIHDSQTPLITCNASSPKIRKNVFASGLNQVVAVSCSNNSNADIENNCLKQMDLYVDASNPLIKNNDMTSCIFGLRCTGNSNPTIIGNKITNIPGLTNIKISKSSAVIKNNYFYTLVDVEGNGCGVLLDNADNSEVFNNIFKGQKNSNINKDQIDKHTGISIVNSQNVDIINNTFDTKNRAIDESGSTANIINNIVVNNDDYGISFLDGSTMDYNAFWNNKNNYNGNNPGSHNIFGNVMFVDTSKDNYRLLKNSLCINAGNPDQKYNDKDGSRNDIGAYGGPYADSIWTNQDGSTLAINQLTVKDTIQIQIKGENVKGLAEINFDLSYDPFILTILNATSSSLTKSFSIQRTCTKAGTVNIDLKSSKGILEDNGALIELKYAVNSPNTTTTLHFSNATAVDETSITKNISTLKDGQITIITGVDKNNTEIPKTFSLSQNYPNPFNPSTSIRYELPVLSKVKIMIYDILGREITTLINETRPAGRYEIKWNASRFSSGVYFYRIQAGNFVQTKKLMLLK